MTAASFGGASFLSRLEGTSRSGGLLTRLRVGARFEELADADALFEKLTPSESYALRATLNNTPVLQIWGGYGVGTLIVPGLVPSPGVSALLIELEQDAFPEPGGTETRGTATFLLTAGAALL